MHVSSLPLWLGVGASSRQTYTIVPAALSVSEGSSLQFTVNTTSIPTGTVLYYNLSSSSTATTADFTSYSGSFTINSNTGTFTVTLATDLTVESEVFYMDVKTASISGTIVATSPQISIVDTSPTYSLSPASSSVNEGDSLIFTVTTTNVANNTVLYFNLNASSTATTADFSVYSGSCTITSNSSTFSVTVARGDVVENEYFYMDLKTGSITGTIVATSSQVTITDVFPTYSVIPQASSVNEGSSLNFTVATTYVADGTVLYFNLASGSTATTADFSTYSGSCTITSNASTFSVTLATDTSVESEYFYMDLKTGSITGTIIATSSQVTITDTSPTYSVSPSTTTVTEGNSVVFTITTTNVTNGTTLYWAVTSSSTTQSGDLSATSGSFTISSNSGTVSITVVADTLAESEYFAIDIRTGSTGGTIVATSSTVTILDVPGTISWQRIQWQSTGTILGVGSLAASSTHVVVGQTAYADTVWVVDVSTNTNTRVYLPASTGAKQIPTRIWYQQGKFTAFGNNSADNSAAVWQCSGDPTVSGNWTVTNITGFGPNSSGFNVLIGAFTYINGTYVQLIGASVIGANGSSEYIYYSTNGTSWTRSTTAITKTTTDDNSGNQMATSGNAIFYKSRNLGTKIYYYNSNTFTTSSAFTQGTPGVTLSASAGGATWTKEAGFIVGGLSAAGADALRSTDPISLSGQTQISSGVSGGVGMAFATNPSASETTRALFTHGTQNVTYSKDGGITWSNTTLPSGDVNGYTINGGTAYGNTKFYLANSYWGYLFIGTMST